MKKIILDFETTNMSVFKAQILEICILFVKNNAIVKEYCKKIKFPTPYSECDANTISSLNFNNIYSQEDIDTHNLNTITVKEMLDELLPQIKNFAKVAITGWNNATYDNLILRKIMEQNNYDFGDYFDYHSRDIYSQFQPIYEKFLKNKFRQTLSNTHKHLFPEKINDKSFHNANYDCYATLDIDIWIEKYFEKITNNL